jgi:hypothetical protein
VILANASTMLVVSLYAIVFVTKKNTFMAMWLYKCDNSLQYIVLNTIDNINK